MSEQYNSFREFYQSSAYAMFPQEHRGGGSLGLEMHWADQQGHDFSDPPLPQLLIVGALRASGPAKFDFGDGWRAEEELPSAFVQLQPPLQQCHFDVRDPTTVLIAAMRIDRLRRCLEEVDIVDDPFAPLYADLHPRPDMLACLRTMWAAMRQGGPANNLLIDGAMMSMLGQLVAIGRRTPTWSAPVLDDARLARVIDYIEVCFADPIRIRDLAAVAALSTVQFSRAFKSAVGRTPHAYVTARRIAEARRLLATTQMTVTEIGFQSGFGSTSHFSTAFTREMGVSPSAYRAVACS